MPYLYNIAWVILKAQLISVGKSLAFGLLIMACVWFLISLIVWATWPLSDPLFQWAFDFVEGR